MRVIFDERNAMKTKWEDRDVGYDKWPDIASRYGRYIPIDAETWKKLGAVRAPLDGSVQVVATVHIGFS